MKSVDVTRVIPSRCATSVAIVDLPVPVAPPTSSSSGSSSRWRASSRRSRRTVRVGRLLADQLRSELAEPVEIERDRAALGEVAIGVAGDEVRTLGIEARSPRARGP